MEPYLELIGLIAATFIVLGLVILFVVWVILPFLDWLIRWTLGE
jgi:hypothetical protein